MCTADDCGPAAAEWLSQLLRQPCRLVRVAQANHPAAGGQTTRGSVGFANEGKLLLVSRHSVDLLNRVLEESTSRSGDRGGGPVTPLHFRPNLVVGGGSGSQWLAQAHAEDRWQRVLVCGTAMRVRGPRGGGCLLPGLVSHSPFCLPSCLPSLALSFFLPALPSTQPELLILPTLSMLSPSHGPYRSLATAPGAPWWT